MAGLLDEFDEATPLTKRYCSGISKENYDQQSSESTEDALEQLLGYLDKNPQAYGKILKKKRKEENEAQGLLGFFKQHLWSFWSGSVSAGSDLTEEECDLELAKMKSSMIKAYEYSKEARGLSGGSPGQRFSQRLLQKRMRRTLGVVKASMPPPPPPPPPLLATSIPNTAPLKRRPLHDMNTPCRPSAERLEKSAQKRSLRSLPAVDVVKGLEGSGGRKRLRKTAATRSPGGTPMGGWTRRKPALLPDEDMVPMFNTMLLKKFANVRSPSPSSAYVASPGAFDSPVLDSVRY